MWIKYIQGKHYLSNRRQLNERQRQCQLNPKIHQDGIIRLHGTFFHANLPQDAKLPILLSSQEHFSKLLIQDIHHKIQHLGIASVCSTKAEILDTTRITCSKHDTQKMSHLSTIS